MATAVDSNRHSSTEGVPHKRSSFRSQLEDAISDLTKNLDSATSSTSSSTTNSSSTTRLYDGHPAPISLFKFFLMFAFEYAIVVFLNVSSWATVLHSVSGVLHSGSIKNIHYGELASSLSGPSFIVGIWHVLDVILYIFTKQNSTMKLFGVQMVNEHGYPVGVLRFFLHQIFATMTLPALAALIVAPIIYTAINIAFIFMKHRTISHKLFGVYLVDKK